VLHLDDYFCGGLFGSKGEQSLFPEIWPADLCNGDDAYFLGGKTDF
jgi:hypothetical protein